MAKEPEIIEVSDNELDQLIKNVGDGNLSGENLKLIHTILTAYQYVLSILRYKKTTVQKLKDLLFGKHTEKQKPADINTAPPSPGDPGPLTVETNQEAAPSNTEASAQLVLALQEAYLPEGDEADKPKPKNNRTGHGRRGHDSWENAKFFFHPHSMLKVGNPCPRCSGKLYHFAVPGVWVRFVGQAPLVAEVHKLERLRCSTCTEVFTATPSDDLCENPTATPEARATAAIIKYQAATPFNRFSNIQKSFGHAIPRTTIWTLCKDMASYLTEPFGVLIEQAAQGEILQNDDTKVKILDLMKENKDAEARGEKLKRTGMFTTGIVSKSQERTVYLFLSSRNHAGENLACLLEMREKWREAPIQVCDASDMNTTLGEHQTEVGGCHDHARRKFFEVKTSFPSSCAYALKEWKQVYHTDKIAKQKKLTPEERLLLHQTRSRPALERLKTWCEDKLNNKEVEPAGHLGCAMQYYLNQYETLTLFLRRRDVPLANIDCERALKIPIAVRKMSYFYKTATGTKVSDIIFSFLATCGSVGVNVFDYFVAVQNHHEAVKKAPELWLPWNYQEQLVKA
jgi:transposase